MEYLKQAKFLPEKTLYRIPGLISWNKRMFANIVTGSERNDKAVNVIFLIETGWNLFVRKPFCPANLFVKQYIQVRERQILEDSENDKIVKYSG